MPSNRDERNPAMAARVRFVFPEVNAVSEMAGYGVGLRETAHQYPPVG